MFNSCHKARSTVQQLPRLAKPSVTLLRDRTFSSGVCRRLNHSVHTRCSPFFGIVNRTPHIRPISTQQPTSKPSMAAPPAAEGIIMTELKKYAEDVKVPFAAQNAEEVGALVRSLEDATKKKKGAVHAKKTTFDVADSPEGIKVDSWRFQDWDYKKRDMPTYARGLFTIRNKHGNPEIAIRGYDKFFNVDEVYETKWDNIKARTKGPYELTLKENGCIIFISGLADDTLLVCSKHSTGDRSDIDVSHASAGEKRLEQQLQRIGKTKQDLARELRRRNVTAVAELCDDTFEEHILAYGPEKAGLYLHGMNNNVPEFMTYPSPIVQQFADGWGFLKVGLIVLNEIEQVKSFLEGVAETGAHDGRDIEGFVIRCQMSHNPEKKAYQDWFFKYKFDEPYLMYRQWRECTKALISGNTPKYKKHVKITAEYLQYARQRLAADQNMAKLYNQNHGIIALRDDFLRFKNMKGSDAANLEGIAEGVKGEVTRDVILVPIATIGCGKTTVAIALCHLFGWGHVQNDNITGPKRPPRFTKAVLDELDDKPAVIADRNNAQKHERKQLLHDVKMQHLGARLVALHFVHDDIDGIRRITQSRVFERGDNHQTIQAATDMNKVRGIMEGFVSRFEPCDPEREPDAGFDAIIDLNPTADSRENLETVINELHRIYPNFVTTVPSAEEMDEAIQAALQNKPDLRHTIRDRGPKPQNQRPEHQQLARQPKKKPLEYMSVEVPTQDVLSILEKTVATAGPETSRFFKQLQGTRRVQQRFHVTLMHRAAAKEHPELWDRYVQLSEAGGNGGGSADSKLGEVGVMLERVVFDDRIMAIVVRLVPRPGDGDPGTTDAAGAESAPVPAPARPKWECVNRVAHITVGTRDESVKPKESNDLLARWLEVGSGAETGITDLILDSKPVLDGAVKGVLSSR